MAKIYKTSWDLTPLFTSDNDPVIEKKRKKVERESYKFINKWSDRDDYLQDPKVLKQALDEYEYWLRNYGYDGDVWYYFFLRTQLNQHNPYLKAKYNKIQDFGYKIQNDIQFFTLRIAKIDTKLQKRILQYEGLKDYKHFLERLFKQAKYQLSEGEEKIMNLKTPTSHDNWVKMLSEFLSKEERKVLDETGQRQTKNFSEILSLVDNKNKKVRDASAAAFNEILEKHLNVAENELNSVLQDKKVNAELRGYLRPDKARHIVDDVDTEIVDALVNTVSNRFDIPKRYYQLKARLMKVKRLKYYERNVEYGELYSKYSYKKSVELIRKVLGNLDGEFLSIFSYFVEKGRIDAFPKKGKRGGAFCVYNLITQPVYILLNHTGELKNVLTFAHEFGHGINNELMRKRQNALNFGSSTSTAEAASTFFENFVLYELLRRGDEDLRLSLMMRRLNDDVNTIFRQIAFYNFEWELHQKFREKGYLSKEEIGKIFQRHMRSYMGPYVEQSPGSQNWWVYVSHFRAFFYVYSYASGLLISKSLQSLVKENPEFIEKVKEFLSAGLSDSPKNIFAKLGIDISDKNFWVKGLDEVEALLKETERLAKKLGKI